MCTGPRPPAPVASTRRRVLAIGSILIRAVAAPALVLATSACPRPDADGKYDRFNEQTQDDRDLPADKLDLGPVGETCPDIEGTFLVAIETSIAPGLPLQFLADVDPSLDEQSTDGTITLELQPLSLDVGSTTVPREEVGSALVIDADVVDCSFTAELGEIMVTGAANPLTGSDIAAELSLQATIRSEDAWCGNMEGQVLSPIMASLGGSTFAAMRLADRAERPLEFPVSCAQVDADAGEDSGGSGTSGTGG